MAVSGFRLRARVGVSIPATCGRRGITPAFGYGPPHPGAGGTSTLLTSALPGAHYAIHLLTVPAMVYLGVMFGVYTVARTLVLGDVGSRISVLDKTIREGRAGDADLSAALQREESGNFES